MVHDSGRTLATEHTLIDRMITIALDIPDLAVFQENSDATAAGAHIASGRLYLIGDRRRRIDAIVL